ncbi:MAG: DUF4317 domain-containing protein [Firmicutes bacterium]|nr:DUF4317 domain-containing protein [Bacillota bacterium]
MNTKEISEIKKRLKKISDSSLRICGCYISGEDKNKTAYVNDYLGNMPEDEQNKYFEIIKKTLSGKIDKNLYNIEFQGEDTAQNSLLALRDSGLENPEVLDAFYDYIIENFDFTGNYFISLIYDSYDVMAKTTDNMEIDESVEVYNYVLCSICPVNLTDAALSYNRDENSIASRKRDWVVENPCAGFLFPAFNDRSADIGSLLYYVKSTKEMFEGLTEKMGLSEAVPSSVQKQTVKDMIESVVADNEKYELVNVVRDINEKISEMIEESDEPIQLNKADIKSIFESAGIDSEDLEKVDAKYEAIGEDTLLSADNVVENSGFEVKTNNVSLKVKPQDSSIVKIEMINGRKCLVIPMDKDVEINGILSRVRKSLEDDVNEQ